MYLLYQIFPEKSTSNPYSIINKMISQSKDREIGGNLLGAVIDLLLIVIEKLSKSLEVNYFALAQELYDLVYIGIVAQAENIVVGRSCLLLCCYSLRTTFSRFTLSEVPEYFNFVFPAVRLFGVNDDLLNKDPHHFKCQLAAINIAPDKLDLVLRHV